MNSQCWKQTNALEKYFSFSQLWNLGIIFDLPCVLSLDQCIITGVPSAEIQPPFCQHSGVSHHLLPQINSNFLLSNAENCHFALLVSSENNPVKRIFLPSLQTMSFPSNTTLLSPLFGGHIKPKPLGLYFQGASQLLSALPIVFH